MDSPAANPALGIHVLGKITPAYAQILTTEAIALVARLHRAYEPRRQELLAKRAQRQKVFDGGKLPDFLSETKEIRAASWSVAGQPADLQDRRVEITGPVDRKMVINALNSGASVYMADFEDANCPSWDNNIQGQINLRDAIRRSIFFNTEAGKAYRLNDKVATLLVRPRGWHLFEKHLLVDDQPVSGALFDFAVFKFHNAKELLAQGSGPYFYLPKIESHLEARLWNDVFVATQRELGIAQGTIRATVLIETIPAAFEMEEILYELREHSGGLNAGRWDYIFSCIKKFRSNRDFCLPDRSLITMTVPFMRAYALELLRVCHKRNAPALGGMAALIPIKNDPAANAAALAKVRAEKDRDASDGYDGGWVAHPGLVSIAKAAWDAIMPTPNQIHKKRDDVKVRASDLLDFRPEAPITEAGLRLNINVGIQYIGSWLGGNGCVPLFNLMEDAATAEISRSQVWQWIRSPKGVLSDGRKVTKELVREMLRQELDKIGAQHGDAAFDAGRYAKAAKMFEEMSTSDEFVEFLTLPAYQQID